MINEQIEIIKKQLGINDGSQDEILMDLFNRYLSIAKKICFREDEPPEMLYIVRDIVAGAFQQRGGEGFSSTGAGDQSYKHIDLYDTMQKRLADSKLRMSRFYDICY